MLLHVSLRRRYCLGSYPVFTLKAQYNFCRFYHNVSFWCFAKYPERYRTTMYKYNLENGMAYECCRKGLSAYKLKSTYTTNYSSCVIFKTT